tara:strand:+ start:423 stop:1109 length:687 start_codon:yes stop_codon:yes gene_type:complete
MKLVIIGTEYSGCTSLAIGIEKWAANLLGPSIPEGAPVFHDHFKIPEIGHTELTDKEYKEFVSLSPNIKEMFQRFMIKYHINSTLYRYPDHIMVGFHIEEAVYAPIYYGYGGNGTRANWARSVEREMIEKSPDTVLVLITASNETIKQRMEKSPHPRGLLKKEDIDEVANRFKEQFDASLFLYKITLDTTNKTPEKTLEDFTGQIQPYFTDSDRMRILTRKTLLANNV